MTVCNEMVFQLKSEKGQERRGSHVCARCMWRDSEVRMCGGSGQITSQSGYSLAFLILLSKIKVLVFVYMLSAHGSEQVGIQAREELNLQLSDISEFTEIPHY